MAALSRREIDVAEFIEALKAEIADLEGQLAADPRHRKIKALRDTLELYHVGAITPRQRSAAASGSRPFASGASAEIANTVEVILSGRRDPTPTRFILEKLAERGVVVGGSRPMNSLSSILSKSELFVPHGRSGWTIAANSGHDIEKAGNGIADPAPLPALIERRPDQPAEPRAQGREAGTRGGT